MRKHVFATIVLFLAAALGTTGCNPDQAGVKITAYVFDSTGSLVGEEIEVTDASVPIKTPLGVVLKACGKDVTFSRTSKTYEEGEFFIWLLAFLAGSEVNANFTAWADLDWLSGNGNDANGCKPYGVVLNPGETTTVMVNTATAPVFLTIVSTATPEIEAEIFYDFVPNYNDPADTVLEGHVQSNVDLGPYALVTYLYIPDIHGWSGPIPGPGSQPTLTKDAWTFRYNIVGHPADYFATKIRTYLVPDTLESPTCNVCEFAPVIADAVTMTEFDRSGQRNDDMEIVFDYVPECDDSSNTVLVGHAYGIYGVPNAAVTYLYIPEAHGWSGPFPGEGAEIGLDGKFLMNIVGDPADYGATKIRTYVVPDAWASPTCNICSEAPVLPYALTWAEVQRSCDDGSGGEGEGEGEGSAEGEGEGEGEGSSEGEGEGEDCTDPTDTSTPTLLSIERSGVAIQAILDGVTACSMPNAKLELFVTINFANAPYEYYGVVTKPMPDSPYNQYWPVTGEGVALYYNQDPRDATATEIIVRLVSKDAESEFLTTDTSVADGDPLNLPPLTKGKVLGTARLNLQTKALTVVKTP